MKFAIYGAGSLGLVFAAWLKNKNYEESFDIIDRNPKSIEAINSNGVKVVGKIQMCEKVNAVLDSKVKEKYDIIFLYTKQIGNKETVKKAYKMLADGGVICTMQNGLPEEEIAQIIGADKTYGCAVGVQQELNMV